MTNPHLPTSGAEPTEPPFLDFSGNELMAGALAIAVVALISVLAKVYG